MVETVGVGQSEIEISDLCDMLVLLVSPAQGFILNFNIFNKFEYFR